MPTMDQVVWQNVNLTAGGETAQFKRGDLLPETVDSEEAAQRAMLRAGGALRVVEVVYTAEELADQARARGHATAKAEVQHDVDPALPAGEQVPGTAEPGPPTLTGTAGAPVVIGDEGMRDEHEAASAAAVQAAAERAPTPHATKHAWVDYAVERHGVDRERAEGMTRDQLAAEYGAD